MSHRAEPQIRLPTHVPDLAMLPEDGISRLLYSQKLNLKFSICPIRAFSTHVLERAETLGRRRASCHFHSPNPGRESGPNQSGSGGISVGQVLYSTICLWDGTRSRHCNVPQLNARMAQWLKGFSSARSVSPIETSPATPRKLIDGGLFALPLIAIVEEEALEKAHLVAYRGRSGERRGEEKRGEEGGVVSFF